MNMDEIEVGKTYRMRPGLCSRKVIDIIWHPAGEPYVNEFREAVVELADGKRRGFREKVPLAWLANKATSVDP